MGGRTAWQTSLATNRQVKMVATPARAMFNGSARASEQLAYQGRLTDYELGDDCCGPGRRRPRRAEDGAQRRGDVVQPRPGPPDHNSTHDRHESNRIFEAGAICKKKRGELRSALPFGRDHDPSGEAWALGVAYLPPGQGGQTPGTAWRGSSCPSLVRKSQPSVVVSLPRWSATHFTDGGAAAYPTSWRPA